MITAREFLQALYGPDTPNEVTAVAYKTSTGFSAMCAVDPTGENVTPFERWTPGTDAWYACVSKITPDKGSIYLQRKNQTATAAYVLVLDDIGTKAQEPPLRPTCILETSEGNYQWIYKLTTPCSEVSLFDSVYDAATQKGYSDPGAKGMVRLYRVPGSANTKPGKNNFLSVVTEWSPQKTFSLEDIIGGLGLTLGARCESSAAGDSGDFFAAEMHKARSSMGETEAKWTADTAPSRHPLLESIVQAGGLLNIERPHGRAPVFVIRCPNHMNHSNPEDSAAKLELTAGHSPYSWFYCHHAHCQRIKLDDVLDGYGVGEDADYRWLLARAKRKYALVDGQVLDLFQAQDRPLSTTMSPLADFRAQNMRHFRMVDTGKKAPVRVALVDDWLKGCEKFVGTTFRPDTNSMSVHGALNLHRLSYTFPRGSPNSNHIRLLTVLVTNLTQTEEEAQWLLKWIAIKLSRPETRLPGIIFYSETQGHGKGALAACVRTVLGGSYVVHDYNKMVGPGARFNKPLETAAILELNEVTPIGRLDTAALRSIYSHLKRLNDPTIDGVVEIEAKGVDSKMAKSFTSVWIFTNEKDAVPLSKHDRRFTAIETREAAPDGAQLWYDINTACSEENRKAFGNSLWNWAVKQAAGETKLAPLDTPYLRHIKARGVGNESSEGILHEFKGISE